MKKSDELLKLIQDKTEACKNAHGEEKVNLFEQIKALKKEMARIKEENEILKKAMAIFATRN